MRDFPPLYSAILRALADALAANLPTGNGERHNDAAALRDCATTQHLRERR